MFMRKYYKQPIISFAKNAKIKSFANTLAKKHKT